MRARPCGRPEYLELGARVSERWSPGSLAKVEFAMLTPSRREDPMTEERTAQRVLLQKSGDGDSLRAVAEGCCRY
jgi:hypothetical protein